MNDGLWNDYNRDVIFNYLDTLRESGTTNMFAAGQYLRDQFDMSRREASAALSEWMETFGERHPA